MVFDGEQLTELLEPLGLAWRARRDAELALVAGLVPLLKKRTAGRDISGLSAYEQLDAKPQHLGVHRDMGNNPQPVF